MTIRPGTMKHRPPTTAPIGPRSRQAQRMASCVEAGPGRRLVAAMPSSNSSWLSQRAFDAQGAEQGDVGRRAAEADAPDAAPLLGDGGQGDGRGSVIGAVESRTERAHRRGSLGTSKYSW